MFIDREKPVASFLKGTLILAIAVTSALALWVLESEEGRRFCASDGGVYWGICRPTAAFVGEVLIWFLLIYGALAFPIVSVLLMKRLRPPPSDK